MDGESILILIRHGQSLWNQQNLFTGWVDVPLSIQGIREAIDAGKELQSIPFEAIFTSELVRAQMTAFLAMSQHSLGKTPVIMHPNETRGKICSKKTQENIIPVYCSEALNERMYGDLQGKNKDDTRKEFGEEQVKIWRRSYDTPPPNGESLKMTYERTIPYFKEKIEPLLKRGQHVLVSAHGNSLRSIVKDLEGISNEDILHLEIPTGKPLCYVYRNGRYFKEKIEHIRK